MAFDGEKTKSLWREAWPSALTLWSSYTRLSPPRLLTTDTEINKESMAGVYAMIQIPIQQVVVNLKELHAQGIDRFALPILAHEIGHHVYCPANFAHHVRAMAVTRKGLPGCEAEAPFVFNLFADLLINDRLQRRNGVDIKEVYRALRREGDAKPVWLLYQRIMEILWGLPSNYLCASVVPPEMETDARLGSRVVRVYANHWIKGAGRFAALLLPYLLQEQLDGTSGTRGWADLSKAWQGGFPQGAASLSPEESEEILHPSLDPAITGQGTKPASKGGGKSPKKAKTAPSSSQHREPFAFGELLRSLGITLNNTEIASQYYKERALPHLIPFPVGRSPRRGEVIPEGLDIWDTGDPIEEIDWLQSAVYSPLIIPGVTTMQRLYGEMDEPGEKPSPLDLDLYIDSSGSMPNPHYNLSWLALAGTILTLSALRTGASVQATLWSGARSFKTTGGFVRDEKKLLSIITGFLGGNTAFPLHILRDTHTGAAGAKRKGRSLIVVISDEGADTMYAPDEKNTDGFTICAEAMGNAAGGALALNLSGPVKRFPFANRATKQGWSVHAVTDWPQLLTFARDFTHRHYRIDPHAS